MDHLPKQGCKNGSRFVHSKKLKRGVADIYKRIHLGEMAASILYVCIIPNDGNRWGGRPNGESKLGVSRRQGTHVDDV